MSDKPEPIEAEEPEVLDDSTAIAVADPVTEDGMDAVIAVAEKMAAFTAAMDTILNAIIKRAYPGDFVCHAKQSDPPEKRKANIGAAAAERIAMFLGLQERNWTPGMRTMHDDGKNYTWIYEADFGFKNRWIHAIGRASSKDKFFGWKPVADISDEDIRMAAFRGCRKEGVRGLLGLRGIPIDKLKELGYDVSKVNYVNFEEKGKALDEQSKTIHTDTGLAKKKIAPMQITPFGWKKDEVKDPKTGKVVTAARSGIRCEVVDAEKVKWILWAKDSNSKRYLALLDAAEMGKDVEVHFKVTKTDKGENYQIEQVNGIAE